MAQLLDPSLGSDYDQDQIERMVLAANLCIIHTPKLRPPINLVSLIFAFTFSFEFYLTIWFLYNFRFIYLVMISFFNPRF